MSNLYEETRINDIRVEMGENGSEIYVFDPYNSLNKEITEFEVNGILQFYGIPAPLHNIQLYRRAFVHKSYVKKIFEKIPNDEKTYKITPKPENCLVDLKTKSNDRIEFLGDGVLECITKYYLYTRFPKADEKFMTDTKISLVKNDSLGQLVLDMGLEKWYLISKNAELKKTRTNIKKLGNLFEAFLGAIFLDFNKIEVNDSEKWFDNVFLTGPGFQMAQIFLTNVFEKHVNWSNILENNDNYKNKLQVIIQKEFKIVPQYFELSEANVETGYSMGVYLCLGQNIHQTKLDHALPLSQFTTFQDIHSHVSHFHRILVLLGTGQNKIKKKAEQLACQQIIEQLSSF